MKDILYSPSNWNGSSDSFPPFIRFTQYNPDINKGTKATGTIGDNFIEFSLISNHNTSNETTNVKWLLDKVKENEKSEFGVKINKSEIEKRFYILEIPDYSSQSVSTFNSDFVPLVFINGKKIMNKSTLVLKYFTKKLAFILIDINTMTMNSRTHVDVLIMFKSLITSGDKKIRLTSEDGKHFSASNIALNEIFGDSVNKSISDYDFKGVYVTNKNESYINLDPIFVKNFSVDYDNMSERKVSGQGNYFTNIYRSRYRDYSDDTIKRLDNTLAKDKDKRSIKIDLDLYDKITYNENFEVKYIDLYLKSNFAEVAYTKSDSKLYPGYRSDFLCFNKEKFTLNGGNNILLPITEIIPFYNNKRRTIIKYSGTETKKLKDILASQKIQLYRWNLYDPEILVFDGNGLLKGLFDTFNIDIVKGDVIFLIDDISELDDSLLEGNNELDEIKIQITDSPFNLQSTTQKNLYNNLSIKTSFNRDYSINKSNTKDIVLGSTDHIPLEFVVTTSEEKSLLSDLDFYVSIKEIPVKYEKYIISPFTYIFKLSENIPVDRSILNSINYGFFKNNNTSNNINIRVFDLVKENSKYTDDITEYSENNILHEFNIMNFNERNII